MNEKSKPRNGNSGMKLDTHSETKGMLLTEEIGDGETDTTMSAVKKGTTKAPTTRYFRVK